MRRIRLTSSKDIAKLAEVLENNEIKWLTVFLSSSPYLKGKPKFHQKAILSIAGNPKLSGIIIYVYSPYHLEFWDGLTLPEVELESGHWEGSGKLEVVPLSDGLIVLTPKEEA